MCGICGFAGQGSRSDLARMMAALVHRGPDGEGQFIDMAMVDGLDAGFHLVDELAASGRLDGYHLLPATRADLLRRAGRAAEARVAYEQALELAPTEAERRYLTNRLHEL